MPPQGTPALGAPDQPPGVGLEGRTRPSAHGRLPRRRVPSGSSTHHRRRSSMAILRLTNGSDITVKLSVADLKAAISTLMSPEDFIELPGDDGPIHVRPSHIIAIVDNVESKVAGFRHVRGV